MVSLWETKGKEKLRTLSNLFFKNSKIVIYVYDTTNKNSFNELKVWDKDVNDIVGKEVIKSVVVSKKD